MKLYTNISVLFLSFLIFSCEDVIDVDVQEATERLTIEASINWEKGSLGNEQSILLSTSTPYFSNTTHVPVTTASVSITNNNTLEVFIFNHQNNGTFTNTTFAPIIGDSYSLSVTYKDEIYSATETFISVAEITNVTQSTDKGFDEDALEANFFFTDPINIHNYYLLKFKEEGDLLYELEDIDDEFVDGNELDLWYEKDEDSEQGEFSAGDKVSLELYGISKQYYNYIKILIEQNEGGGPFATTPVALKGNYINITNKDNFANGYFRLTEVAKSTYTFE